MPKLKAHEPSKLGLNLRWALHSASLMVRLACMRRACRSQAALRSVLNLVRPYIVEGSGTPCDKACGNAAVCC